MATIYDYLVNKTIVSSILFLIKTSLAISTWFWDYSYGISSVAPFCRW